MTTGVQYIAENASKLCLVVLHANAGTRKHLRVITGDNGQSFPLTAELLLVGEDEVIALASTAITVNPVEAVVILLSIILICVAFSWDGLVRRHVFLPSSPFGGGYITLRGFWAIVVGMVAALAGIFMLLLLATYAIYGTATCRGSLACIGEKAHSVEWLAWVWLGGVLTWFVLVWLRLGNPYKRVLVYGIWYRQDKVARLVQQELADRGLKALPTDRIYALEIALVQFMHEQHWLVNGKTWLDGGKYTAKDIPISEMVEIVLNQTVFRQSSTSQRAAIEFLLGYFKTEAGRAQRMSPFHRWLVGTVQIGKRQVYGRHAV